ncbi:MAG: hypothetical protein K6A68_02625 [Clostridiales bacterium]|nr:hypothetical protein [Clostridiales bacterium]
MKIVGRILSCLCAFLLAVAILGSQLVIFANHAVKSQSFYIRPGESIRKDQLGEMQQLLDTLAETYGFDVASVSDEVNADAFARYGREVIGFLGSLLEEQEEEAELIFPYYMTEKMLDLVREDEGFKATVEKNMQRTVSQSEIVTPIELKAQKLIFPLRPQLIIAGYNTVSKSVNIAETIRILDKWWVVPCAGIVLILLILLLDRDHFAAWTGSGLAAGSLMIFSVLLFANALDFASCAAQINPLFAKYLSVMWRNICMTALVFAAVSLICGIALIIAHIRAMRNAA